MAMEDPRTTTMTASWAPSRAPVRPVSDLTDAQNYALAFSMIPTATLSITGSTIIITSIIRRWRAYRKPWQSYERILLALSFFDIIFTITFAAAPYLTSTINGDGTIVNDRVTSMGTTMSCNAVGFLSQFSLGTFYYNTLLSGYYYVTIVRGWSSERLAKRVEPALHALIWFWTLGTASTGSIWGWYGPNEIGSGCWINDFPTNCGVRNPWESGERCLSTPIAYFFGAGMFFCFALVLVWNVQIFRHVRKTFSMNRRYQFTVNNTEADNNADNDPQKKQIRQVAIQCVLYVLAFWLAILPTFILRIKEGAGYPADEESHIFYLLMIQSVLTPATGWFNMLIVSLRLTAPKKTQIIVLDNSKLLVKSLSFQHQVFPTEISALEKSVSGRNQMVGLYSYCVGRRIRN